MDEADALEDRERGVDDTLHQEQLYVVFAGPRRTGREDGSIDPVAAQSFESCSAEQLGCGS